MEKVLKLGSRIELVKMGIPLDSPDIASKKLVSSIHEIIDEDTVVITNPTMQARLVPMHPDEKFDCYFFVNGKIYNSRVKIMRNLLDGKMRTVKISILDEIEKYERRQFYRLETSMEIGYLLLTADNANDFKEAVKSNRLLEMKGFVTGTTIDLSGGGVRFTSDKLLPENGMIITHMTANMDGTVKHYIFLGKIIKSDKHREVRGVFE
ncbi:MAG TPA: flagellar brake domain-containing protein, partial [Lachnospiraceae bacterium]|nr:flagellar brake domain-containing protein [Lachnospiraceae bacterium]